MKKFALLVIGLVALSSTASAQFSWGVKVGGNIAGVTNDGRGTMLGLTAGAFGEYEFSSLISLSADVLYSAQGNRYDQDNKMLLNYLNIPVLANFHPFSSIKGLAFKAGLQPGFLLGRASRVDGTKVTGTNGFQTVDLTLPIGVSYEFPLGIIVDARYGFGLTNIYDQGTGKNSVFSLTAGYRF